jgi:hypothetical protein
MVTMVELNDALRGFCGTEMYHKHWLRMLYTDGVKELANFASCYWLIDMVASVQHENKKVPFQLWRIEVENSTAHVTMREDTGRPTLFSKRLSYTDFPEGSFEWYVVDNVMLLKGEY